MRERIVQRRAQFLVLAVVILLTRPLSGPAAPLSVGDE